MKRTHITRNILAAAVLGALAPAFAQNPAPAAPAATAVDKPLCSSLGQPNAGKLAGKSTGMAKEHSNSAVHMDCIPDGANASGTGASMANPSATATPVPSSSTTSGMTASTTEMNSSQTGSTSTFTPSIDVRGRSSVTIDNDTTTGDQSLSSSASTTTGDAAVNSGASGSAMQSSGSVNSASAKPKKPTGESGTTTR